MYYVPCHEDSHNRAPGFWKRTCGGDRTENHVYRKPANFTKSLSLELASGAHVSELSRNGGADLDFVYWGLNCKGYSMSMHSTSFRPLGTLLLAAAFRRNHCQRNSRLSAEPTEWIYIPAKGCLGAPPLLMESGYSLYYLEAHGI